MSQTLCKCFPDEDTAVSIWALALVMLHLTNVYRAIRRSGSSSHHHTCVQLSVHISVFYLDEMLLARFSTLALAALMCERKELLAFAFTGIFLRVLGRDWAARTESGSLTVTVFQHNTKALELRASLGCFPSLQDQRVPHEEKADPFTSLLFVHEPLIFT